MFGLSGKVFEWFQSYLEQFFQRVFVHDILFDVMSLLSSVSQGSGVGPLVVTMNTCPLVMIAQQYGIKYYLYPEDEGLYISGS